MIGRSEGAATTGTRNAQPRVGHTIQRSTNRASAPSKRPRAVLSALAGDIWLGKWLAPRYTATPREMRPKTKSSQSGTGVTAAIKSR
jgi:hypothetical protein